MGRVGMGPSGRGPIAPIKESEAAR